MTIDLSDFESRIQLRRLRLDDYDRWRELMIRCFPTLKPWLREQMASMIERFEEGQLCIEVDGILAAACSAVIIDYNDYTEWHDYLAISDQGYIRNHDPDGDTLYGIEMMVDPDFRGRKLARRLYDARKQLCRDFNCARMVVGGRIPGYAEHRDALSAQEYVERVVRKQLYDPVLTTQLANGFQIRELIEDYLPNDEDSGGWATNLEWPNLDYVPERGRRRSRRAVDMVRLGFVQFLMRRIDSWEDFERQCEFFVDAASDQKADFILFPELFTTQLLSLEAQGRPEEDARLLAALTPRYLELFGRLAREYNVNVIGGSQLAVEDDGRLYNIAYLFRRDGTIAGQKKLHVTPAETRWWGVEGGDRLDVLDTDCGKIAILICYDIEFPELARHAVAQGAQVLFVPSNTYDRRGYLRVTRCAQARCIENQVYVVTAGCVGNLPLVANADTHYFQSGIYTPSDIPFARDGIATQADPGVESMVVQDVDLELLRRARRAGTVRNWNDRRHDLYEVVFRSQGRAEPPAGGGESP
ncbi:MAG: GNAT family N-acetyltransferase [Sandaracinaceae bacterium]